MFESCLCHNIRDTGNATYVCLDCGRESDTYLSPQFTTYAQYYQTNVQGYSRVNRFIDLFSKIIGISSGPTATDPVWNHLAKNAPYDTCQDIVCRLKQSSLRNKHYADLHIFCKCFLKNYKPLRIKNVPYLLEKTRKIFEDIAFLWNKYCVQKTFFSYAWLMERMLCYLKLTDLLIYLKPLQCKHRRDKYRKYIDLFIDIENEADWALFLSGMSPTDLGNFLMCDS